MNYISCYLNIDVFGISMHVAMKSKIIDWKPYSYDIHRRLDHKWQNSLTQQIHGIDILLSQDNNQDMIISGQ